MSRAATAQAAKKDQKAAIAEKNAEKERLAALGMTKTIKQAIGDDKCLCTQCGATSQGPIRCECPGGVRRPDPEHDGIAELIAAAKLRMASQSAEVRKAGAAHQDAVRSQRVKAKEAREHNPHGDLEAEFQGDDIEVRQVVEFPVGKLGFDIEKNAIFKVGEGNAEELGVKAGWVVLKVNDDTVQPTKKAIIKATATCMKAGPVKFTFRVPIMEGYHHCALCDKFLEADSFEESQLENGPGKQLCSGCEDFADVEF